VRWEVTDETLDLLRGSKEIQKLNPEEQEKAVGAVADMEGTQSTEGEAFAKKVQAVLTETLPKVPKPLEKAVLEATSVRDPEAPIVTDAKGNPLPDPELRGHENVPLTEDVSEYMERQVLPFVPDAWLDEERIKIGYEIPLTRHFYRYEPPRPLEEIDAEIKQLEEEILDLLKEVTE
jgi:type I restriction enzyme M protein